MVFLAGKAVESGGLMISDIDSIMKKREGEIIRTGFDCSRGSSFDFTPA